MASFMRILSFFCVLLRFSSELASLYISWESQLLLSLPGHEAFSLLPYLFTLVFQLLAEPF